MIKFLNRFINILLMLFITLLMLNGLYVVQFSNEVKNVLLFLSLIAILYTTVKDLTIGKSGLTKFISSLTLLCTIIGGVMSILSKQLHYLIYICVLFSFINSIIELVYSKA